MNDVGWGPDSDHNVWGAAGSVALLVTAGLYWTSLWLVSGLTPLPSLASRALWRVTPTPPGTSSDASEEHAYE